MLLKQKVGASGGFHCNSERERGGKGNEGVKKEQGKPAEEEGEKRKAEAEVEASKKQRGKTKSKDTEDEEVIRSPTTRSVSIKQAGVENVKGNVAGLRRVQTAVRRNSKG
jgi:hypothetical protein